VWEGYDNELLGVDLTPEYEIDPAEQWTPEERRELADFMIALWTRWRATNQPK
jgi:hypothetical protein